MAMSLFPPENQFSEIEQEGQNNTQQIAHTIINNGLTSPLKEIKKASIIQEIIEDILDLAMQLEATELDVEVVDEEEVDLDTINVGCAVKVYDITFEEEMDFKIVGSTEANSLEGKISNESPVGHALIGKTVGDVVDVETQAGLMQFKVLEISRSI